MKLICSRSVNPEIDQFCIADGTPVGDDILFEEYLEMTVSPGDPSLLPEEY